MMRVVWRTLLARIRGLVGPGVKNLGREGERLACCFLKDHGYTRLGSNLRLKQGEIDLLFEAPDGRTVVVVEVKSRLRRGNDTRPIAPEAAITSRKQAKLLSLARSIKRQNHWEDRPVRIDVVAVEWKDTKQPPAIRHHPGAVKAQR